MTGPALWTFWSGLAAGAGINILTGLAFDGTMSSFARSMLLMSGLAWCALAACLAYAGTIVEERARVNEKWSDLNLGADEMMDLRRRVLGERTWRFRASVGLAVVCLVGGAYCAWAARATIVNSPVANDSAAGTSRGQIDAHAPKPVSP